MIRVGLVGVGGISRVHILGYDEIPNVKLVAAADIRGEEAANYALIKERGIPLYRTMEEMLAAEELDMVDICTPTYTHAELAIRAMEFGKHVLSEKPMARTSSECERILEAIKTTRKRYMTAHVVRFMKPYAYLRQIVEGGELGKPLHIMMHRLSATPTWSFENWMATPSKSGGAPLDLSIHDIDFIQSVFGVPKALHAAHRQMPEGEGMKCDHITTTFFYDGLSVDITGTFYPCAFPFAVDFTAVFEKGYVQSKNGVVTLNGQPVDIATAARKETGINISSDSAYAEEIAYFVDAIEADTPTERVLPESGYETIKLIERIVDEAKKV